ncbi:MAG: MYXO-CTERM sorting domain-containing protein [bacterium]
MTGECVPIMCPDGGMLVGGQCVAPDASICGPGQTFQDGRCQAICGDGLRWDPTCNQCRYQGIPCDGQPSADGGASDDCGCRMDGGDPPAALLLLLLPLLRRRRRA